MVKETKFAAEKRASEYLACDRGFAEQIEDIRRHGNHGVSPVLRAASIGRARVFPSLKTALIMELCSVVTGLLRPPFFYVTTSGFWTFLAWIIRILRKSFVVVSR